MFNGIVTAQVTAHNPPWSFQVVFRMTGQMVSAPIQYGRDYIDPLRVEQKPMPALGSLGVVLFPHGDLRNGVWICSLPWSFPDALTVTSSGTANPLDAFIDYRSHFSGHWDLLDGSGNFSTQFADGTSLVVGTVSGLPTIYRHTVDANSQKQITAEFTRAERIPNPPSPFYVELDHSSGTTCSIDVSGNVAVSGAVGASLEFNFGGTTVVISSSGNVTVSGATGATSEFVFGGTAWTIDSSGKAILALTGTETFNITQGGGSASDFIVLVSKLVSIFNAHTHKGVSAGSSNSGTPTTNIAASDVKSAIFDVSG